jgi:hypothetical protein
MLSSITGTGGHLNLHQRHRRRRPDRGTGKPAKGRDAKDAVMVT